MRNKQFTIMQAIAIFLVLIGHKGEWIFPFTTAHWPIYSYHMPLFVFISGYFFKASATQRIGAYIWKKCKHLLLPYFGWNLFYGLLMKGLTALQIVNYHPEGFQLTWSNFFWQPWVDGHQYFFNLASWFVLTLFTTQVVYVLIRKGMECCSKWTEGITMLGLLVLGAASVFVSSHHMVGDAWLPLCKLLLFLPFFHFGYVYKTKWEAKDTLHDFWYFLILLVVQVVFIVNPDGTRFGAFRMYFVTGHSLMPFITSTIGILFWLRVSRHLAKWLGEARWVLCVGENTWSIMMHHLLCYFLINLCLSVLVPSAMDRYQFQTDAWYTCTQIPIWIYWVAGLYLPVLWQKGFDACKSKLLPDKWKHALYE